MTARFETKGEAREAVWTALEEAGVAAFPFPPHGRIPNYRGAADAARRLLDLPVFRAAERIKVNPDAPQRYVRVLALERGIEVFVPTPRLAGGFRRLDPRSIPEDARREAASLSKGARWSHEVPLDELPPMDAIVAGSVAVTREGRRCGKGEGYSDLEFAILRELGHPPAPVATTIHPLQLVEVLPTDPHDLPLEWIATPDETVHVEAPLPPPSGIDWGRLSEDDLEAMPVLAELRDRRG